MAVGYVLLMFYVVKPFLKRVGDLRPSRENMSKPIVAIFFLTLILSSYATEVIGIHALFGAFIAGVVMPNNIRFKEILAEKVEDLSTILLLPIFFAFTGLRTQIGLLNQGHLWVFCILVISVAIIGKLAGSTFTAKIVGRTWKDSLSLGALMNTRGLMELIVLNIGYDLGVFGPELFSIMVIMALFTTFMTGPILDFINLSFMKFSRNNKDNG
jgi:Kef-type K+ transport system membrane component KefB